MRYKLLILLITCAFFGVDGQNITISGNLTTPNTRSVVLTYDSNAFDFIEKKTKRIEIPLDANNNFNLKVPVTKATQFNLQIGKNWVLLSTVLFPGDSIYVRQRGKSYAISGTNENELSFQAAFNKKYRLSIVAGLKHDKAIRKLEPIEFAKFIQAQIEKEIRFMHAFDKRKKLREDFMKFHANTCVYENGAELYRYCGGKRKRFLSDTLFIDYLQQLNINNDQAIEQGAYLHFIRELMFFTWNSKIDRTNIKSPANKYYLQNQYKIRDSVAKCNFTGNVLDLAYYTNDVEQIVMLNYYKGRPKFDSIFQKTASAIHASKNKYQDSGYFYRLRSLIEEQKTNPQPAPDFELKDLDGNLHKLSDYKGKIVYLDFWSTSCGPCLTEIPALNALIEKYKGRDVVFISVAFDNNLDRLRRFLTKKPINGTLLVEEKGFGSAVAGAYQIASIPRYCIVDKEGNLINKNAPRPSLKPEEIIDAALLK